MRGPETCCCWRRGAPSSSPATSRSRRSTPWRYSRLQNRATRRRQRFRAYRRSCLARQGERTAAGRCLAAMNPHPRFIAASDNPAPGFSISWSANRRMSSRGASLASAQLAQLLFIQVLRAHLKTSSLMPAGWLRALGDPRLAPALRLMHGDPGRDWHLEELARRRPCRAPVSPSISGRPPAWRRSPT